MKKRILSMLLVSVMTVFMLAGCGGDTDTSTGDSGTNNAAGSEVK